MAEITRIEIEFPVPVEPCEESQRLLHAAVNQICGNYKRANPGRTMWAMGSGSKPMWSQKDALLLGKTPNPLAPFEGEPEFDDSVYQIECSEKEATDG